MLKEKIKTIKKFRELALRWRHWRSKHSYTSGCRNTIVCKGIKIATRIQIDGSDNQVIIDDNVVVRDSLIKIQGNNCEVRINKNAFIAGSEIWIEDNDCKIAVGQNTFIGHHTHIACTEDGHKINIGNDCLISSFVQIRTGDSHSILTHYGERINKADDIVVCDHCWIGQGAKLLKGVNLGKDCVVATGAIVTKSFENNTLIGGIPAKKIKSDIKWDKQRI